MSEQPSLQEELAEELRRLDRKRVNVGWRPPQIPQNHASTTGASTQPHAPDQPRRVITPLQPARPRPRDRPAPTDPTAPARPPPPPPTRLKWLLAFLAALTIVLLPGYYCAFRCREYPMPGSPYPAHGLGSTIESAKSLLEDVKALNQNLLPPLPRAVDNVSYIFHETSRLSSFSDTLGQRIVNNFTYSIAVLPDTCDFFELGPTGKVIQQEASYLGTSYGNLTAIAVELNVSLSVWRESLKQRRADNVAAARTVRKDIEKSVADRKAGLASWQARFDSFTTNLNTVGADLRFHAARYQELSRALEKFLRINSWEDSECRPMHQHLFEVLRKAAAGEEDRNQFHRYFSDLCAVGRCNCRSCPSWLLNIGRVAFGSELGEEHVRENP